MWREDRTSPQAPFTHSARGDKSSLRKPTRPLCSTHQCERQTPAVLLSNGLLEEVAHLPWGKIGAEPALARQDGVAGGRTGMPASGMGMGKGAEG